MNVNCETKESEQTIFLYPISRQFPFDEVCEKIVRALEIKGWIFPGIEVEFSDSVVNKRKYRYVEKITGDDFKLVFRRVQGMINKSRNDIAAVHELFIPKGHLDVYDDESGPRYHTYVGKDWKKDKRLFFNGRWPDIKLRGEDRWFLYYHGEGFERRGERPPYLENSDDNYGRQYLAQDGEPKRFQTDQVFQEFKEWLTVNVLKKVEIYWC